MKRVLKIQLDRKEVYTEVQMLLAYTGVKASEGGEGYRQHYATDAQTEEFGTAWNTAMDSIDGNCRQYLRESNRDEEGYEAVLDMPHNWAESLEGGVVSDCKTFTVYYIAAMWLRVTGHSDETKYLQDAETMLLSIRTKLNSRKRPTKPWDQREIERNPHWFGVEKQRYDDVSDSIVKDEEQ